MTAPGQAELTPRQQQILQLLQAGKVNKEVARELDIGLGTVKQHIVAIFRKLKVRNRTAAVFRNLDRPSSESTAIAAHAPKILLSARPCVVLVIGLPVDCDGTAVRALYSHMASMSSANEAIFLTRQGNAGELIFGVQKVTEYDAALALNLASRLWEAMGTHHPSIAGRIRGCLTAGIGFASMRRYGGWSGEAIASGAISVARDLLQTTPEGFFSCDQAARDLCAAFGISGADRLHHSLPFNSLTSLQWSGLRSSPALVGRSQELKVLNAAIDRALHGKGSVVILEGEMGMGKSRICQALTDLGTQKGLKSICFRALPDLLGSGLLDTSLNKVRSEVECLDSIRQLSGDHFVIVDDFHLLHPDYQEAWFDVADKLRTRGMLTILATRRGVSRPAPIETIRVPLGRLSAHQMQALLRQALNMPAGKKRASVMQTIMETSTGVPLFALEMARMPDPVKLPLPLMVAVQSRIDKFQLDNSVLRMVANSQHGISMAALADQIGEPTDTLLPNVERATATGVLIRGQDGLLGFAHPMVRRVIANSIMD